MHVSVCIQHHPRRAGLIPDLLEALGEEVEVVADPEPNGAPSPWRTYRRALELTPPEATHRMILQDDIVPCTGFLDAARAAVAARPNRLLAFFVAGVPLTYARAVFESCARDWPWAVLTNGTWCPAIANVWPVEMVRSFLAYADTRPFPAHFTADDEIIGRYLTHSGQTALASVPSLVEHPDVTASMVGRRALAGHDTGRIAACLIDDDCDARLIDWTAGPG